MKKTLSLALIFTALASIALSFSACTPDRVPIEEPTHIFEKHYTYDDVFHWRVCTDEDCSEITDEQEHTLDDGECFCGYLEDSEGDGDVDEDIDSFLP